MKAGAQIHHFKTDPFNWYVVEQDSRLTVVDAGFPGHYRVLVEGLSNIGREIKDVEAIILTHSHADHTGFAEKLRKQSKAPVFIHKDDLPSVKRILQLPWPGLLGNVWRTFGRSILAEAVRSGIFQAPYVGEAFTFKDGEVLEIPGRPQVIHVPGHTAGEVVFHLPDMGVLFSGDTLVTQDLMTGAIGRPQIPHPTLNSDDRQARRSIDRLNALGQVKMLPGHGIPWAGSIREAIELDLDC